MPIATFYDVSAKLLRIVGEGVVTMEDRQESFRQILQNSEYSSESAILANVSGITNAPVDFRGVAHLIQILQTRFSGRIAIVNTHAGHVTISNLIALSTDLSQTTIRVFASEPEAMAWFKP